MKLIKQFIPFLLLAAALVVAACGAPTQAERIDDEVSLQLDWVHQAQFAGYYLAQQEGLYQAQDLRVKLEPGGPDIDVIQRLLSKEVDFAVVANPVQLLQAIEQGAPVVAVAAIFQKDPQVWISRAEDNIVLPQDIIGKKVGVQTANEAAYRMLLTVSNIDASQITEVPTNDFTIRPLVEGAVDVLPAYALNEPLAAKAQGIEVNSISLAQLDIFFPSELIIVHQDLLNENPDLIKRFVESSVAGWTRAVEDQEEGLKATLRIDETLNVDLQRSMMQATAELISPETAPIGHMSQETWEQTVQLIRDQGLISEAVEPANVFTAQFVQ